MGNRAVENWGHINICNTQHVENATSPFSVFFYFSIKMTFAKNLIENLLRFLRSSKFLLHVSHNFVIWQPFTVKWLSNIFQIFDFFRLPFWNWKLIFVICIICDIGTWTIVNWGYIKRPFSQKIDRWKDIPKTILYA